MNEEENIDKTLAILRTQEAEQAVVMEQYRVAGRRLAAAEQQQREEEQGSATRSREPRRLPRLWTRKAATPGSFEPERPRATSDLLQALRLERKRLEAEHGALGDPSTEFKALLERKAHLLLAGSEAPQELRDIDRQHVARGEWREVVLSLIVVGEAAKADIDALIGALEAAGGGRPAAGMLLNEAVIESTSVDGIADQAVDSIRRFDSALMGAGLPPLAIEEDFRLGNGVFFTALGVVSLAGRAALQLQVQQVLVRVRLARETALKPLAWAALQLMEANRDLALLAAERTALVESTPFPAPNL